MTTSVFLLRCQSLPRIFKYNLQVCFQITSFHDTYRQILNLEAFALEKDKVAGNAVVLAGYI